MAKRTVYLHFENKAAVFLAILEYLGDQVRQRCAAGECMGGTAVDRLTGMLFPQRLRHSEVSADSSGFGRHP